MSTIETNETFSAETTALIPLLREAEEHHGPYEAASPPHHWSSWYAAYIVARQTGRSQDDAIAVATARVDREIAAKA